MQKKRGEKEFMYCSWMVHSKQLHAIDRHHCTTNISYSPMTRIGRHLMVKGLYESNERLAT